MGADHLLGDCRRRAALSGGGTGAALGGGVVVVREHPRDRMSMTRGRIAALGILLRRANHMDKDTEKSLSILLKNTPLALIVIGILLCIIGAAGGWPYPTFKVDELAWRIILAFMGVIIAGTGILLLLRQPNRNDPIPDAKQYKFRITYPEHKGEVEVRDGFYEVRGTYEKKPPAGYSVTVFEIYPGIKTHYRPRAASLDDDDKTWRVPRVWGGYDSGAERRIGVALVGASARALFDFYQEVGEHYDWKNVPGIYGLTPDVRMCHEIRVRIKKA